jgi:ribosomal protein S18 acetylase RimI-like enzyme
VVYNTCNKDNWGFVPLNENEFLRMAKLLKMIAPLDLAILVEKKNEIIGFVVAVPNINQALKHVPNGKLFPLGLLRFLWYKRKINKARVMILGVLKEYGGQGIDLILYHKITEALAKHKIYEGEASFVLESNTIMNSVLKKIGGKRIKTYRIYNKSLLEKINKKQFLKRI